MLHRRLSLLQIILNLNILTAAFEFAVFLRKGPRPLTLLLVLDNFTAPTLGYLLIITKFVFLTLFMFHKVLLNIYLFLCKYHIDRQPDLLWFTLKITSNIDSATLHRHKIRLFE